MADKSHNKTLAQKTSTVQSPKRSHKWPRGHQEDTRLTPPSPSINEEGEKEEEEENLQPPKPKKKRGARSKSRGRKQHRISSAD